MVKVLDRESINRMVNRKGSGGVSGGGGGSDIDLGSYATKSWTDENYVGKEFFSSLFKAYDADGNEVLPNDTETTIDNIKAMFGFWTDFYISALGTGGHQSVDLRLAQLADVNVAGVTNGQVLTYDSTSGKWIASTPQSGTDMATVWANLAASGNQQINYSHLSGAVSLSNGTITIGSSSITPITSHQSLAGYAKEQWVSQNYLPLTGGEVTGTLVLSKTQDASGSADNGPALVIGGTRSQAHIEIDKNEILAKSGGTGITTLYLQDNGGEVVISGDLTVNGGDLTVNEPNASGASAIWFQSGGTTYGNLRVKASNGEFYFYNGTTGDGQSSVWVNAGGFYAYGQVVALSDARHKRVIGDTGLTVKQIAEAPAIRFTWKDRDDQRIFAGSIAQYWQKVLPDVVQSQDDGTLSLDYQVAALISSITVARKVMNHESRLQRLERMFAINEDDIED